MLLCVRAPVGKVNITDRGLCIGRGLCAIIPLVGMPLLFAYYLLAAYENIFVKQATGTTFVAITAETVKNQLIPMPPLAEQQRIADLIERLIPYVDEYGKAESAVDQLNCHFPEALKKSILQEAVQGKLVPQDPSDEPAEALLERIRAEKQRLIKEGKIKKDKHESVIFRRDNTRVWTIFSISIRGLMQYASALSGKQAESFNMMNLTAPTSSNLLSSC